MKNIIVLLLILFISKAGLSQNLSCKIIFSDGALFEGFCEITKKEKILFRLDEKAIPDEYGPGEIDRIEFYGLKENRVFEYVAVKVGRKKTKFLLMERIEDGKITLYYHYKVKNKFNKTDNNIWNREDNLPINRGQWEKVYIVKKYFKLTKSAIVLSLNNPNTIKNVLIQSFADCPSVLAELEIIGFENNNNIEDLVWQYNRDCSGIE